MNILTTIEDITKKLHVHLAQLSLTLCSSFILLLLFDLTYGFFSKMPLRSVTGIGKRVGSVALLVGGVACLYYILREAYIRSKKNNLSFHVKFENSIKKSIQIFRHIHPLCGVLVCLLVLGHAYLLWHVAGKTSPRAIYSGIFALLSLGLVTTLGTYIVYQPKYLQMRKYHRLATGVLLLIVAMHLMIS